MKTDSARFILLAVFIALLQIIMAIALFVLPALNNILTEYTAGEIIIGYLSFETAVIGAVIAYNGYIESVKRHDFERKYIDKLDTIGYSRWLSEKEFYDNFLDEIINCKSNVNISYLSPSPPTNLVDKRIKRYYTQSVIEIKKRINEDVQYRRIIRMSSKNWSWINGILHDFKDVSNMSIAVLKDLDENTSNPLSLSVQTVDGQRVYLVALEKHTDFKTRRDLKLSSQSIGEAFEYYYERLWKQSVVLLNQGQINQEIIQKYRKLYKLA